MHIYCHIYCFLNRGTCLANSPAIKSCNPCLDRHSWSKSTETWFSMAGKKRDATLRWCDECCISNAVAAVAQPTLVGVLYWLGRSSQITCILESRYLDSICFASYMCIHDISVSGVVLSCTRHSLQIMLVDNPGSPVFHAAWSTSKGWKPKAHWQTSWDNGDNDKILLFTGF